MLIATPPVPGDIVWELAGRCRADARPGVVDLTVGVYRDATGNTPTMGAVTEAERRLALRGESKTYQGPAGDTRFTAAVNQLVLGDGVLLERATAIQAVAGTGALRLVADFLKATGPDRTVLLGTPAYANHPPMLEAAGLRVSEYPVEVDGRFSASALFEAVQAASPGDVLLIQGGCHNPTGWTMPEPVWAELGARLAERGVVPFVDHAYFGLADGLEPDLRGARVLLEQVPDAFVAVSGSKAWGLYNERAGSCIYVGRDPDRRAYVLAVLEGLARSSYSRPPAHGASIVTEILTDHVLSAQWRGELEAIRQRLEGLRTALVEELQALTGGAAWVGGVGEQKGMFLKLPLSPAQMELLHLQHAVYGLPTGRINVASLPETRIADVAAAVAAVAARVAPGAAARTTRRCLATRARS